MARVWSCGAVASLSLKERLCAAVSGVWNIAGWLGR